MPRWTTSGVFLACLIWVAACSTKPPPQPALTPVAPKAPPPPPVAPPPSQPPQAKGDDWNIFPDPTTGRVEVYKNGEHVGSITGDEPEDPPMPHKIKPTLTQ